MKVELVTGWENVCNTDLIERIDNEMDVPSRYFLSSDGKIYAEIPGRNPVSIFDTKTNALT